MSATVLVIYTGGTIGSVPEDPRDPDSPLRPADGEALAAYVPNPLVGVQWELAGLEDETGNIVPPIDSSSLGPRHWAWISAMIGRRYDAYDGFVVLHGTDTMAHTASALSFLLENLGKPVVLTGAQMPIHHPRTDAVANLVNALHVAGGAAVGLPIVPEVTIAFGDHLSRGNRATKASTAQRRGFATPNLPPLAEFIDTIAVDRRLIRPMPAPDAPFRAGTALDTRVMTFSVSPGMAADQIAGILALDTVRGYVLRAFGAGNAPEDEGFLAALKGAIAAGKTVVCVSQCFEGRVEMRRYAVGARLRDAGVISGQDMTVEAALTKLMWALARPSGVDSMETLMRADLRGELTPLAG